MSFVERFIQLLFEVLFFAILGRVLLSWIDQTGESRIARFLYDITEPILGPIRSVIPSIGMIDISPIIAMLLLQVIQKALLSAL